MPDATIHTIGELLEMRSDVLFRVSLPNGKEILAHLERSLRDKGVDYKTGDRLLLEMTPYDFDGGRILGFAPEGA
ncbi:MAG: translation initiation factor IF-1 [Akkermansiaceae bacterium]|nr:translation initiation factor IF-1 [Akkermansiaceae bacterium]